MKSEIENIGYCEDIEKWSKSPHWNSDFGISNEIKSVVTSFEHVCSTKMFMPKYVYTYEIKSLNWRITLELVMASDRERERERGLHTQEK